MDQLDELTRLAAEELMKEAKAFVKKRELNPPCEDVPRERKVPNRRFLKNTLRDIMFVNKSMRKKSSKKIPVQNLSQFKKDTKKGSHRNTSPKNEATETIEVIDD